MARGMTVQDLIEQLSDFADSFGGDTEVRLASQPNWPFELSIGEIGCTGSEDIREDESEEATGEPPSPPVIYIGEGRQLGYLPGIAARAIGWKQ